MFICLSPILPYARRLSLEVMTLNPRCESVETSKGVPLTVTGVAQVKVMTEEGLLAQACEQFIGRSISEIETVVLQTLEGHLRAILGRWLMQLYFQFALCTCIGAFNIVFFSHSFFFFFKFLCHYP